jgi:hypothetical protein
MIWSISDVSNGDMVAVGLVEKPRFPMQLKLRQEQLLLVPKQTAPLAMSVRLVNKKNIFDYIKYGALGLSTFLIGFIPFNNRNSFLSFVLERFEVSANQYPYGSVNAFSFWGIFGFWKSDNITFWIGLVISVLIISILFLITLKKRPKFGQYTILSISLLTTFLFNPLSVANLKTYSVKGFITMKPAIYILLLAWNYADSIIQKESWLKDLGVKFIKPVPEVTVL